MMLIDSLKIYKRKLRLKEYLKELFYEGILTQAELRGYEEKLDEKFDDLKKFAQAFEKSKRIEPACKSLHKAICKKGGCDRPVRSGFAYCCRDHSPLGNYDLPSRKKRS